MKKFLLHFILPQESNNHRSKVLHHISIFSVIILLFVSQFFLVGIKKNFPDVLGISHSISSEDLLLLTNQKRAENGLPPLSFSSELSAAAGAKASDMFAKGYWSHNAPDGTTPWVFIKGSGYNFIYAGENLAKGFTSSTEIVNAWMGSPSHRENIVSGNFKEVGFSVVPGVLNGEETVLVVQMFGSRETSAIAGNANPPETSEVPVTTETDESSNSLPTPAPVVSDEADKEESKETPVIVASSENKPFLDSFSLSWNLSTVLIVFFISALLVDLAFVERNKIIRIVGHNLDHVFFLASILAFIFAFQRGGIL